MKKVDDSENTISFEDAYKRLEDIANLLEGGDIALEKSFNLYEEGQKMMKICQKKIGKMQKFNRFLNPILQRPLLKSFLIAAD